MECKVSERRLSQLDCALIELGMIAASTNARREYLQEAKECRNRALANLVTINTRYVSNVSINVDKRSLLSKRYQPYHLPKERNRTRSENNEDEELQNLSTTIDKLGKISLLKKATSLENVADFKISDSDHGLEVETVSDSIQNLKVGE